MLSGFRLPLSAMFALSASASNVCGRLSFSGGGPAAATVEGVIVRLRSSQTVRYDVATATGQFCVKDVESGRYSLELPIPGRLTLFKVNGKDASPVAIQIPDRRDSSVSINVSLDTGRLNVQATGVATLESLAVLLIPDDAMLTVGSIIRNTAARGQTTFEFVPPGRYLVIITTTADEKIILADLAKVGRLKTHGTPVYVTAAQDTAVKVRPLARVRELLEGSR